MGGIHLSFQATWEAEIWMIMVPGSLMGEQGLGKVFEFHLKGKKLGVVVCVYHPSKGRKHKIEGSPSGQLAQKVRLLSSK
jgi:hypothetical protein